MDETEFQNAVENYLKTIENDVEVKKVKLTRTQIHRIKILQRIYGQSLPEVVLLLVHSALMEIEDSYVQSVLREQTIKN